MSLRSKEFATNRIGRAGTRPDFTKTRTIPSCWTISPRPPTNDGRSCTTTSNQRLTIAEGRKVPTRAHRAIAKLVRDGFIKVIITTNFDRLIENALVDIGVEPTIIASDDDLKGAVPLIHSRCYVVKVHGDYLDTRIRNTEAELAAYSAKLNRLLDRIIDEHGLIICGWSSEWDSALRAAIKRAPNRRYPFYWAFRGTPTQSASHLLAHRAGKLINIEDADNFFGALDEKLTLQAELQRPDPRSTELLVASTKRFLRNPEHRIQLDELVGGEVRELLKLVRRPGFPTSGNWPNVFIEQVSKYEAIVEPLARMFGVMGRWGTGTQGAMIKEYIGTLSTEDEARGLEALLALRTYPGVLLFYAYGLGLLQARRYTELFVLLSFLFGFTFRDALLCRAGFLMHG